MFSCTLNMLQESCKKNQQNILVWPETISSKNSWTVEFFHFIFEAKNERQLAFIKIQLALFCHLVSRGLFGVVIQKRSERKNFCPLYETASDVISKLISQTIQAAEI